MQSIGLCFQKNQEVGKPRCTLSPSGVNQGRQPNRCDLPKGAARAVSKVLCSAALLGGN